MGKHVVPWLVARSDTTRNETTTSTGCDDGPDGPDGGDDDDQALERRRRHRPRRPQDEARGSPRHAT